MSEWAYESVLVVVDGFVEVVLRRRPGAPQHTLLDPPELDEQAVTTYEQLSLPDTYCYEHNLHEEAGEGVVPYLRCFECGHLYLTAKDLLDSHNEEVDESNRLMPSSSHELPHAIDPENIGYCSFCLHDL